jgi:hypothetical protein
MKQLIITQIKSYLKGTILMNINELNENVQ